MKRTIRNLTATLLGAAAASAAATVAMAGGFEVREQSTYFQGTSWAGAAAGGSLSSMFWNPAAMGEVGAGITTNSNYALLLPKSEITATGFGAPGVMPPALALLDQSTDIGRDAIVPATYAAVRISPDVVFGLGLNSQFGLGTKPDNTDWVGQTHGRAAKLFSIQANPTVAYQVMPGVTLGGGLQIQYLDLKRFKSAQGFGGAPLGPSTNDVNLHGNDIGIGATAGIMLKPAAGTTIGLGYRGPIHHNLDGRLENPPGAFDITAKITTPEKVTGSIRQELGPNARLMGTVEWTNWSRLDNVDVKSIVGGTITTIDFGWEDGWLYSVGGEYDVNEKLTVRAGVAYEKSPIQRPESRLITLPDNDRIWASIGASYKWSDTMKFDVAYSHVFVDDGTLIRDNPRGIPLFADVEASVDILSVGLTMKLGAEPAPAPMK